MSAKAALTRVWRESWGQWWAELWVPSDSEHDSPPWTDLTASLRPEQPEPVVGYRREEISLHMTRGGARNAAASMLSRHKRGLHPLYDRPPVEVRR